MPSVYYYRWPSTSVCFTMMVDSDQSRHQMTQVLDTDRKRVNTTGLHLNPIRLIRLPASLISQIQGGGRGDLIRLQNVLILDLVPIIHFFG